MTQHHACRSMLVGLPGGYFLINLIQRVLSRAPSAVIGAGATPHPTPAAKNKALLHATLHLLQQIWLVSLRPARTSNVQQRHARAPAPGRNPHGLGQAAGSGSASAPAWGSRGAARDPLLRAPRRRCWGKRVRPAASTRGAPRSPEWEAGGLGGRASLTRARLLVAARQGAGRANRGARGARGCARRRTPCADRGGGQARPPSGRAPCASAARESKALWPTRLMRAWGHLAGESRRYRRSV